MTEAEAAVAVGTAAGDELGRVTEVTGRRQL